MNTFKKTLLLLCLFTPILSCAYFKLPSNVKSKNKNLGYLRFINASVDTSKKVYIRIVDGKKKIIDVPALTPFSWSPAFSSFEPESYSIYLIDPEKPDTPISEKNIKLKQDQYHTFIILGKDGKFSLEMVDDTYSLENKEYPDVHIRNFYKDMPLIVIEKGKEVHKLNYGEFIEYKDVNQSSQIVLKAPHPEGSLYWSVNPYDSEFKRFFYYTVFTDIYDLQHDLIGPNPEVEYFNEDGTPYVPTPEESNTDVQ